MYQVFGEQQKGNLGLRELGLDMYLQILRKAMIFLQVSELPCAHLANHLIGASAFAILLDCGMRICNLTCNQAHSSYLIAACSFAILLDCGKHIQVT